MPRRLSCSMTIDAVRDQSKTVTRRHVDTWPNLKPGDRLTLIEKGMGLAKGAKQVVLCDVEIVSVRVETLRHVNAAECQREGLPEMNAGEFCKFWAASHGYRNPQNGLWNVPCRRIEWRYLGVDE